MDFAALAPEVISGRMYAGPGSGSMMSAAAAWARLAAETGSAARGYQSALTHLTDEGWLGPASQAMAAAATPYVAWLDATAALAEQTAARATAAAAAFDEALAAVVPPPVIAANRATLAGLVATNLVGQNSAAIAALDAEYAQQWVQDAVAMYGYAARSAAATALTPFTEPPATSNLAGPGGQAAAVAEASGGSVHAQLSQLITAIPQALNGFGPAAGVAAASAQPAQTTALSFTQVVSYVELVAKSIVPFNDALISILYGMGQYARNLATDLDIAAATGGQAGFGSGSLAIFEPPVAAGSGPLSAGLGNAATVGRLSVPPNWVTTAPVAKVAAAVLPSAGLAAAPAAGIPAGVFSDLALAGLAGRALTGAAPQGRPAAAMNGNAQSRLERLVTELAGTTDVQHWHVDPSRLDDLLEELAEQPGVHAVHVNPDGQNSPGPDRQPG